MPLVDARRSYVLDPAAMGIGMDDPLLAEQLSGVAPDAAASARPEALTYRVAAEEEPPDDVEVEVDTGEPARETFREVLVTLLMTTLGAGATYYVAKDQGLDIMLWTGVGGGWGLLVGWACIRWMRGKR